MNRIKNIEDIILGDFDILAELVEPVKSKLIKPESMNFEAGDDAYAEVKRVGQGVIKYKEGDILMKFSSKANGFIYKDRKFLLVPYTLVSIAVRPDNFDKTITTVKMSNKTNKSDLLS